MIVQVQMHKNLILLFVFLFFSVAQAQVPSEPTNLVVTPINTGGICRLHVEVVVVIIVLISN